MGYIEATILDKTSTEIRAITVKQIRSNYPNEVHAEKTQRQLLRLANEKELVELEAVMPKEAVLKVFPKAVFKIQRIQNLPCILIWSLGEPDEGENINE